MPADDVLLELPTTVKSRTEEIVIRNQDPERKRVDVYQSLRPMRGGLMGNPMETFVRSVPVDEALMAIEIDGITGAQVFNFLSKWAAAINDADGRVRVAEIQAGQ